MEATLIVIAIAAFILVAISAYHLGYSKSENMWIFEDKEETKEWAKLLEEKDAKIARLEKKITYLKSFRYNEAIIDADFDEEKKGENKNDN